MCLKTKTFVSISDKLTIGRLVVTAVAKSLTSADKMIPALHGLQQNMHQTTMVHSRSVSR